MKKNIPLIVGAVVVFGGLLYWAAQMQSTAPGALTFVEGTNVACLPNGHEQLAVHIHPVLSIMVDGAPELVPTNIGIIGNCMAELHTHDASGTIHVETATTARLEELSFADFFAVWGEPIEREGYALAIRVNGAEVASLEEAPLEDRAQIELIYTSL